MSLSLKLLEELEVETDLALDYVEHEVGANSFLANWRATADKEQTIAHWLRKIQSSADPAKIVQVINELEAQATRWLTPYTSPIPPEDQVLPSLLKPKPVRPRRP